MFNIKPNSKTKILSLALAGSLFTSVALPVSVAQADHRSHFRYHGGHGIHHHRHHPRHVYRKKRNRNGDLIAAGVIGLALGAIIASEANKNRNEPNYRYRNTRRSYVPNDTYYEPEYRSSYRSGGPDVITYEETASLEPWTPGWREWCSNRYRSFNQRTGTYRGYDGLDHFCVPK